MPTEVCDDSGIQTKSPCFKPLSQPQGHPPFHLLQEVKYGSKAKKNHLSSCQTGVSRQPRDGFGHCAQPLEVRILLPPVKEPCSSPSHFYASVYSNRINRKLQCQGFISLVFACCTCVSRDVPRRANVHGTQGSKESLMREKEENPMPPRSLVTFLGLLLGQILPDEKLWLSWSPLIFRLIIIPD